MSLIQWGAAMRAAVRLGVSPEQFWRLSLREWRMLTEDAHGDALSRDAFETLQTRRPDAPAANDHKEELR